MICRTLLLSVLAAAAAPAQGLDAALAAFGLRNGSAQDLALPRAQNARASFTVDVILGGAARTLLLRPATLRAAGYTLLVDDGNIVRSVPAGPDVSYRGAIVGAPASDVAATFYGGQLHAWIDDGAGSTWVIEPLSRRLQGALTPRHIVYAETDVLPTDGSCGVPTPTVPPTGAVAGPQFRGTGTIRDCQIALDCDYDYYLQNGASPQSVQAAATALIAGVDLIYRRDCSICYTVTSIVVRTAATYTSGSNVGCTTGSPGLLQEMQSRWNSNQSAITRDTAHLLSGKGIPTGTVGCAFNGIICSGTRAYGVSRVVNSNAASNVVIVAHELGHNWDADHCDASASCQIMCSNQSCGPMTGFGPTAVAQIIAHRDSRPCLNNCSGCTSVAEYSFFGSGCAGTASGSGPGCVQLNFGTAGNTFFNQAFETAMPASTGAQPRYVTSVDLNIRARTGSETIGVMLRARDAFSGEPGAVLGSGTITATTSSAVYTATLGSPVYIDANTDFFVSFDNPGPNLISPLLGSGTATSWWAYLGGSWSQQNPSVWSYRLNCIGSGAPPVLDNAGVPSLGTAFDVRLGFAPANAPAALLWGSAPATVDLSIIGATGCSLYVGSIFTTEPRTADANGSASWTINVPTDTGLCGFALFHQIAVVDVGANALSVVTTRRGMPVFGN